MLCQKYGDAGHKLTADSRPETDISVAAECHRAMRGSWYDCIWFNFRAGVGKLFGAKGRMSPRRTCCGPDK